MKCPSVVRIFNWGYRLGFIPFRYDPLTREFTFEQRRRRGEFFFFSLILALCSQTFLITKKLRARSDSMKLIGRLSIWFNLFLNLMGFAFHLLTWMGWRSTHSLLNESSKITKGISVQCSMSAYRRRQLRSEEKKMEYTARFLLFLFLFVAGIKSLSVIAYPSKPDSLSSLVPSTNPGLALSKGILVLFQCIIYWFNQYGGVYHVLQIMQCANVLYGALSMLQLENFQLSKLRKCYIFPKLASSYRRLSILHTVVDHGTKFTVLVLQSGLIFILVLRLFMAVHAKNVKYFLFFSLSFHLFVVTFRTLSKVSHASEKTLQQWQSIEKKKWFGRFCRSAQPLRVSVGGFYNVDYTLILTSLTVVCQNTTTLLFTFKGYE